MNIIMKLIAFPHLSESDRRLLGARALIVAVLLVLAFVSSAAAQTCNEKDAGPTLQKWQAANDKYSQGDYKNSIPLFVAVANYFGRCAASEGVQEWRHYNHLLWQARALYYAGDAYGRISDYAAKERFWNQARLSFARVIRSGDGKERAESLGVLDRMGMSRRASQALMEASSQMSQNPETTERLLLEAYTIGYDDGDLGAVIEAARQLGRLGAAGQRSAFFRAHAALSNAGEAYERRDCLTLLDASRVSSEVANRIGNADDDPDLANRRDELRRFAKKYQELAAELEERNECRNSGLGSVGGPSGTGSGGATAGSVCTSFLGSWHFPDLQEQGFVIKKNNTGALVGVGGWCSFSNISISGKTMTGHWTCPEMFPGAYTTHEAEGTFQFTTTYDQQKGVQYLEGTMVFVRFTDPRFANRRASNHQLVGRNRAWRNCAP